MVQNNAQVARSPQLVTLFLLLLMVFIGSVSPRFAVADRASVIIPPVPAQNPSQLAIPAKTIQQRLAAPNFNIYNKALEKSLPLPLVTIMHSAVSHLAPKTKNLALNFQILGTGHPSNIYHLNESGVVTLLVWNSSQRKSILTGRLLWTRTGGGAKHVALSTANPSIHANRSPHITSYPHIGVTHIKSTPILPGQAMRIALPVRFNEPGHYAMEWWRGGKDHPVGGPLVWVIPTPHGEKLPTAESQWLGRMPPAFFQPDNAAYIADYMRQTGVRRFLLNLRLGRSVSANSSLLHSLAQPKIRAANLVDRLGGQVVLYINLQAGEGMQLPSPGRIEPWLRRQLGRLHNHCFAVVVNPVGLSVSSREELAALGVNLADAQAIYHRIQFILKKINPDILILPQVKSLGADCYCPLLPNIFSGSATGPIPASAVALPDRRSWLAFMHTVARLPHPPQIWVLPPTDEFTSLRQFPLLPISPLTLPEPAHKKNRMGAALALAAGALIAPAVPDQSFAATAHWLGGAVLFATVHRTLPPFITVFQGNGRAIALIAGLGAGTIRDYDWYLWLTHPPLWRNTPLRHQGTPNTIPWHHALKGHFPVGHLTIFDPDAAMHSFNSRGKPLFTMYPGEEQIPLNSRIYFLTEPGSARNLVAALRTAEMRGLPPALISPIFLVADQADDSPGKAVFNPRGRQSRADVPLPEKQLADGRFYVRWYIRNAKIGRLRAKVKIQTFLIAANVPHKSAKPLVRTHWQPLDIPAGQFITITVPSAPGIPGKHLLFQATLRQGGYEERVTFRPSSRR